LRYAKAVPEGMSDKYPMEDLIAWDTYMIIEILMRELVVW